MGRRRRLGHFVLAAAFDFVAGVEAVVKLGLGTDAGASDREIFGQGVSTTDGFGLGNLDALEDGRLVEIEPVALKVERSGADDSFGVVEEVFVMYRQSIFVSLMESNDTEVGSSFKVGIFGFGVVHVYGVIVECPGILNVSPDDGDSASDPRLATAGMRPKFLSSKMGVLKMRPVFRPVTLEKGMPSDVILCSNRTSALSRVSDGVNILAIEPSFDGLEEDGHEFQIGMIRFEIGSEFAQERGAPGGSCRVRALEKVGLDIGFAAADAIFGINAPFGFWGLGG
jgi:hypothetical protein